MAKILIAGDFVPNTRVAKLIEDGAYQDVLAEVIPYTDAVDYAIVNLEAPVVVSESAAPIDKCGPSLKCSPKAVEAIKFAGFDMVTLANNHFYDYGDDGVRDTLDACKHASIDVVGGGVNLQEASKVFYKEIQGLKFAFINCCEHEFSIATPSSCGSNPINPIQQYYSISEARKVVDYVIVITHGGPEKYIYPTPRMKELYRFFIDAGADVVVNHHQHCYSGYEVYKDRPIFYGLGNFCFDYANEKKSIWNTGFMLSLTFGNGSIEFLLIPYTQGFKKPGVEFMSPKEKEWFNSDILNINRIIQSDLDLHELYAKYSNTMAEMYLMTLEPYTSKYLKALRFRNLLPSTLSRKRVLNLLNYIKCESHLERFESALLKKCKSLK